MDEQKFKTFQVSIEFYKKDADATAGDITNEMVKEIVAIVKKAGFDARINI